MEPGIFMFRAVDMILAFEKFRPNMLKIVKNAVETSSTDLDFLRLNPQKWNLLDEISIDFAIMEKARNLVAIPFKLSGQIWENGSQFGLNSKDHQVLHYQIMQPQLIAKIVYYDPKVKNST